MPVEFPPAVTDLHTNAAAGRGLWAGLSLTSDGHPIGVTLGPFPVNDPHCTLLHVGKQPHLVEPLVLAASYFAALTHELTARIGGYARFAGSDAEGDPLVILLQQPRIRSLASSMRALLEMHGHVLKGDFDYTPHLTVTRIPRVETTVLSAPARQSFIFRSIVVCGDASLAYPLEGPE